MQKKIKFKHVKFNKYIGLRQTYKKKGNKKLDDIIIN